MSSTSFDPLPAARAQRTLRNRIRTAFPLRRARGGARRPHDLRRGGRPLVVRGGSRALALVSARGRSEDRRAVDARRDAPAALPDRRGVGPAPGASAGMRVAERTLSGSCTRAGTTGSRPPPASTGSRKSGRSPNGIGDPTELALRIGTLAREAVLAAAPALDVPAALPERSVPTSGCTRRATSGRFSVSNGATTS